MTMSERGKGWVARGVLLVLIAVAGVVAYNWPLGGDGGGGGSSAVATGGVSGAPPSSSGVPATGSADPPSAPPTYINALPGEVPPVRPVDDLSDPGVEAFFRYFIQAVDWGMASMDPALIRGASLSTCRNCQEMVTAISNDRAVGQRYEGDRYMITRLTVLPSAGNQEFRQALARVDIAPYTVYAIDGTILGQGGAQTIDVSMTAEHRGSAWYVAATTSREVSP